MMFFMSSNELALREESIKALKRLFAEFKENQDNEQLQYFFESEMVPALKKNVTVPDISDLALKAQFTGLIRNYVIMINEVNHPKLTSFKQLQSLMGDEDSDFFSRIWHIQLQKRFSALRNAADMGKQGKLSDTFMLQICDRFIFRKRDAMKRGVMTQTKQHIEQAQNEALLVYTSVARNLPWNQYFSICKRFAARLSKKEEKQEREVTKVLAALSNGLNVTIPDQYKEDEDKPEPLTED